MYLEMACNCKAGTKMFAETVKGVVFGEKGLMLVHWIDSAPRMVYGDVTGYPYPFDAQPALYVDERDGLYLLGNFVEAL